jgi:hypothetical protein
MMQKETFFMQNTFYNVLHAKDHFSSHQRLTFWASGMSNVIVVRFYTPNMLTSNFNILS